MTTRLFIAVFATVLSTFAARADEKAPQSPGGDPSQGAKHTNRLAKETSPHLLLHAHNPVDWYPWGPEALEKAKRENKPIFLSIGYSSCHWCHVMERESFLDEEIARVLNERFVCVKVDREERPDIDSIYMTALQIYNRATGNGSGGGWPMSMFLTPDCKPFFGGTYFPARDGDRGVATGFLSIVNRVHQVWSEQPDRIQADGETLTKMVKSELDRRQLALTPLSSEFVTRTLDALEEQFDPQHGGFGYVASQPQSPKFPEASNLVFLIGLIEDRETIQADRKRAETMLYGTLEALARGGIRDHLGGGFHRYSVDRYWFIPHFEKMLYDNGQLASVYSEAYRLSGKTEYRQIVEEILAFVKREMTDSKGAYYSALDAESEGEEGRFYRWEKTELDEAVPVSDRDLFFQVYRIAEEPNFEEKFYVPQLSKSLDATAKELELSVDTLNERLDPIRRKLLELRSHRPRPRTDTKILTSWNGLMIRGLADAARCLKQPEYAKDAERAANFLLQNVRTSDGRLMRTHSQGQSKLNAYLDDYAFLVDGLIGLYQATEDRQWLAEADRLTQLQIELFWDDSRGGFYFTSDDHESLIARGVDPADGAEPSGNSVSAANLIYLAKQLDKPDYRDKAERTLKSASGILSRSPTAAPRMALAIAEFLREKEE